MIETDEDFEFLTKECFGGKNFEMKTLFRGTEHGFKKNEFWKRVHNQENVFYLIKSEHNRTFGGFFKVKLTQAANDTYFPDKDALIL